MSKAKKKTKKLTAKEEAELRKQEEETLHQQELQNQLKAEFQNEKKLFNLRCGMLADTIKWMDNLEDNIERLEEIALKEKKWKLYLACEELPIEPKDIRSYLFKWFYFDLQEELSSYDWCLHIDERSILTQDNTKPNLTKRYLQSKVFDIGNKYADRAKEVIRILELIEEVIEHPSELPSAYCTQLVTLKQEIRKHLVDFVDIYTFRILCNAERDMERIDAVTAEYIFQSDIFSKYLWALKDLPMRNRIDVTEINLNSINANMTIPVDLPIKKSSFRGIWLSYDHYSDYAPSYKLIDYPFEGDSLREAIIREWNIRRDLNANHVTEMKHNRIEWENLKQLEMEAQIAREQTKNKKDGSGDTGKKVTKTKKTKKETLPVPPIADDTTIVDVENEYCQIEYSNYRKMLISIGPEAYSLQSNDINLRDFNIYGGIYCFHFLELPIQSLQFFNNFILRQIYLPNILKYKNYYKKYENPHIPAEEDIEDPKKFWQEIENNKGKLIEIKIKLPDNVCWWDVPVVCRWEIWEESEEFIALDPKQQFYNLHYNNILKEKESRLFNSSYIRSMKNRINHVFEDFNMDEIPKNLRLQYLIENEILPRLPSEYKFESELLEDEELIEKQKKKKMMLKLEEDAERMDMLVKAEQARNELFLKIAEMEENGNPMDEDEIQKELNEIADLYDLHKNDETNAKNMKKKAKVIFKSANNLFPTPTRIPDTIINPKLDKPFVEYRIETNLKLSEKEAILFSKLLEHLNILRYREKPIFIEQYSEFVNAEIIAEEEITDIIIPKSNPSSKKFTRLEKALKSSSKMEIKSASKSMSKKKIKSKIEKEKEEIVIVPVKEKLHLDLLPHAVGRWTTNNIFHQTYDPTTKVITFHTGVLGVFGLAASKHYNFPYKKWELKPNPDIPMSVIFSISCKKIDFNIVITTAGYLITLPNKVKLPVNLPTKPISFKQLKKILLNVGLNIFPERDAACYIKENVISEKHYQMEMHLYKCIGPFCLTHNFHSSEWNRFSDYRTALIQIRELIEKRDSEFELIKLSPINVTVVTVTEKCTDLSVVELEYKLVQESQEVVPDLYKYLINHSNELSHRKQEETKFKLRWNVSQLFIAVRPISFS